MSICPIDSKPCPSKCPYAIDPGLRDEMDDLNDTLGLFEEVAETGKSELNLELIDEDTRKDIDYLKSPHCPMVESGLKSNAPEKSE